jgi:phosphotransferase system enzyme I (PtsP)
MGTEERDYLSLLCDIGELAGMIRQSTDIRNLLDRTVDMLAERLQAEVCSIYLCDEQRRELVLRATRGLHPGAVGKVRMAYGTGLVGATLEGLDAVVVGDAPRHPRFKYFSEAREEAFRSFLAVPLRQGEVTIGVLVLQHSAPDRFTDTDARALKAVAAQLAGVLQNVQLLMDLKRQGAAATGPAGEDLSFVIGQAASPGFACGPAVIFDQSHVKLLEAGELIAGDEEAFHRAVSATVGQLDRLQAQIAERLPESAALIFSSHILILKDAGFTERILSRVRAGIAVSEAVRETARHYIRLFGANPRLHLQEKAKDMEDLAGRLLANLAGGAREDSALYAGKVVIAPALYPSEVLRFAAEGAAGLVLTVGGVTSHVTILARSLGLPLVIAARPGLLALAQDTPVLIDGEMGNLYVRPGPEVVERFRQSDRTRRDAARQAGLMLPETRTADGTRVRLLANINLLREAATARDLKAEGIGLYRTEFPFLIRANFPAEEEEYRIYRRLCDAIPGRPVTFRTLDIGGDKVPAYWEIAGEPNPQLGLRSIRFSLRHPEQLRQQVRAILRAGADTPELRIMFPMISSLDEYARARELAVESLEALRREGMPHHDAPALGAMVEVPALVEIAEELARIADFLSVGTNDFVQYLLGVDRMNEQVAYAYRPEHPSVLRALKRLADAAARAGREISVCGEMASDPDLMPFLLGIGIRTLSADPQHLPALQRRIGGTALAEAGAYAEALLAEPTLSGVHKAIQRKRPR